MSYLIKENKLKNGKMTYTAIVRVMIRGQKIKETATYENRRECRDWAKETELQIKKGKHNKNSEIGKHTLGELVDRFINEVIPFRYAKEKDRKNIANHLLWWKKKTGKLNLDDVTPSVISKYKVVLKTEPYEKFKRTSPNSEKQKKKGEKIEKSHDKPKRYRTGSTVNRYLASLSVALKIACNEWEWVLDSPMKKVGKEKEPRGRVRFLSDEEHAALLQACKVDNSPQDKDKKEKRVTNPNLYIVVVIALTSGARFSEIMNLKWEDVDFNRRLFYFLETKNKERRSVPISQHAHDLLQEHKKVRRIDTKYVFPGTSGHKALELKRQWGNAIEKAGLKDFRFHDLRHTAASYFAVKCGASLLDIAKILGHKNLEMTHRYSHLTEQHTAKLIERTDEAQFNKKAEVKAL